MSDPIEFEIDEFTVTVQDVDSHDIKQGQEVIVKDDTYQYIRVTRQQWRKIQRFVDGVFRDPIVISQIYEIAERKPESLRDAQFRDVLRHALGLDYQAKPFRNRYVTGVNCDSYPVLVEMEKAGLVARARTPMFMHKDDVVFYATDKGYALVGATKEERDL